MLKSVLKILEFGTLLVFLCIFSVRQILANSTASVLLAGNVAERAWLEVFDYREDRMPMTIDQNWNQVFVFFNEHYNIAGGYDIDIQSTNGGMKNGSTVYDYRLRYRNGAGVWSAWVWASTAQASPVEVNSNAPSPTPSNGVRTRMRARIIGVPNAPAGFYLDEITLTIRAP